MSAQLDQYAGIKVVGGLGSGNRGDLRDLLSRSDAVVDFTTADAAPDILFAAADAGVRPISGTTGLPDGVLPALDQRLRERGIGGVWAPNFAIGAVLMVHFARIAARFMDAAEVIELHHDRKLDAPSGTAVTTARAIRASHGSDLADPPVRTWILPGARGAAEGGVRLHSVRLPGLVAHQEVLFGAAGQLLTVRHDALSREAYVPGVALAVRAAMERVGLARGLESVLGLPAGEN